MTRPGEVFVVVLERGKKPTMAPMLAVVAVRVVAISPDCPATVPRVLPTLFRFLGFTPLIEAEVWFAPGGE